MTLTDPRADEELRAGLADVEAHHPGWHTYLSDERHSYAVTTRRTGTTGSGVTLDADSPRLLDQVIWAWEYAHPGRVA